MKKKKLYACAVLYVQHKYFQCMSAVHIHKYIDNKEIPIAFYTFTLLNKYNMVDVRFSVARHNRVKMTTNVQCIYSYRMYYKEEHIGIYLLMYKR